MNKLYINNTSKNNKAMKTLFSIATLSLLALTAQADEREKGFYIGGGVGRPFLAKDFIGRENEPYLTDKLNNNIMYSINTGYRFSNNFRADINAQFRNFKYHGVDDDFDYDLHQLIKNYTLFLNAYLDLGANNTTFTPYLTFGLGYSYNNPGNLTNTVNSPPENFTALGVKTFNFSYNFGAGTLIKLSKNIDLDFEYRWVNMGKVEVNAAIFLGETTPRGLPSTQSLEAHELTLGLIYNF